ncbi:MAG: heme exporter protein CcmD [Hyphomonas sp.]|jgi:heme exporter protein CcmD|nr:heme exporter protein CcmD [uncultured Hyphomonas sp.]
MLPDFDKNAVFIWACYGIGAVSLGLTILIVTLRAKASQARMQRAEARLRGDDAA